MNQRASGTFFIEFKRRIQVRSCFISRIRVGRGTGAIEITFLAQNVEKVTGGRTDGRTGGPTKKLIVLR